ncbi:glutamine--fructose-6-phosphate transaminase (isomerizing) [Candidatus Woesearchaeota archaeon]|nr:glutamine--fructose-6-phosphate transaminase (isomerizing) [Candidatus Woesearchaeota archaeon]
MCGIIGYKGSKNAVKVVLNGLKRLEYRGYDSWGIAVKDGNIKTVKEVGKIGAVSEEDLKLNGQMAIAHTRWATHGGVNQVNAHPHLSNNKKIAVVHTGIVENYVKLREFLKEKDFEFFSGTDTEVIPNLIQYFVESGSDFQEAVNKTLAMLDGNFAIVVINQDFPEMIGARNGSPLVVGKNNEGFFIASDVPAFLDLTNQVSYLDDKEMVVVDREVNFFDLNGNKLEKEFQFIDWTIEQAEKGNYGHFMMKEIMEQKETIRKSIEQEEEKILEMAKLIKEAYGVFFVACGTAAYATRVGGYLFSKIAKKHVNVVCGSEFPYYKDFLTDKTLMVVVSQSGETADTIGAVKVAKEKGVKILSIVNVMGSTLMRMADYAFLTNAGPEIGVASTKATTAQIALLTLLAYACNGGLEEGNEVLKKCIDESKELFDEKFVEKIEKLAEKIMNFKDIYVIGRGTNFPVALEAAHKIKEVSYIHAEGMAGGELKHGTIALIDKGTPCVVMVSNDETKNDIISNAMEIKARGGFIIGISPEDNEIFDFWIKVPDVGEASAIVNLIPAQMLAYFLAVKRKCDPDQPRNLAKSVTVK